MLFTSAFATATRRSAVAAALVVLVSGCATVSAPVSVADTIAANPTLSTLSSLIQTAGLTDTLKGAGPFTVFAPTNEAFKAVPANTLEALGKDPVALKGVLTYHVVAAKVMAADVKNGKVKTVNGAEIELSKAGDFVTVGESAIVTQADIAASNGVVHVIDAVLLPPAKK